ncbi:MAG: flippase-like domain-containing protein [Chloroflexi bacterium]|nr:flippase-like domain-containing protein [Chloroflexota bacterium]
MANNRMNETGAAAWIGYQLTKFSGFIFHPSRRWLVRLLGLGLSLAIAAYVGWRLYRDWSLLGQYEFSITWQWLLLTLLAQPLGMLLAVWGWLLIMRGLGESLGYKAGLKVIFLSNVSGLIPGSIWALGSRVYLSERQGLSRRVASVGMVLDLLLMGLAALYVYLITGLISGLNGGPWDVRWLLSGLALGIVAIYPPIFRKLAGWATRREGEIRALVNLREILTWLGVEITVVCLGGVGLYGITAALTDVIPGNLPIVLQAWAGSIIIGNFLFWLPGTLVVREGISVLILSRIMPVPMALIIVVAWRIWNTLAILITAFLAMRIRND